MTTTQRFRIAMMTMRVTLAQRLVRLIMCVLHVKFGHRDIWDDYLHDNTPDSWDDERYANYSDRDIELAHDLLIRFVRDDMNDDATVDFLPCEIR